MTLLTHLRRHSAMRRLGKTLEKHAKAWLYHQFASASEATPATPATLKGVKRVLFVRPNFRIGNALISARLIDAFAQAHPNIEIDYLATDTTVALFENLPLSHCHTLSRDMLVYPWKLLALRRTLRLRRYDLAIQMADTSLTGWLCLTAAGAQRTLGADARLAGRYDAVYRVPPGQSHAYDMAPTIAQSLGLRCEARPWMMVSPAEQAHAGSLLQPFSSTPFDVGVFVGGHLNKRLPLVFWQTLCDALNAVGIRFVLLIGPEEASLTPALQQHIGRFGYLAPSLPLRTFAAVLSQLPRLVTPDTGPMHMAVALGIPVTALLNVTGSQKFAPRGHADQVLLSPTTTEVVDAITKTMRLKPASFCASGEAVLSCVSYS